MATKTTINKDFNCNFKILIKHKTSNGYETISPIVESGVKWETDRQGSPGKLTFKLYDGTNTRLTIQEGDGVALTIQDGTNDFVTVFNGFVFTKTRNKDGWVNITAYDHLRYLKNKATYVYTNKKASEIVKMIANDYNLPIGTIEDTPYVIGERVEDDQSLFDIIQYALDLTLIHTNKMYVLYSDEGKLCLRNAENLKTSVVINDSVASDFDYKSSIDEETYNEIELYYDDDKTKKRQYFHAVDTENVSKWGRLRLTENVNTLSNIKERTKEMLSLYNRKTRELKVKEVFGDYRCRAGASVIVDLDIGDTTVSNYMMIEKATHTFKKNEYRMDLTLDGFSESDSSGVTYQETDSTYILTIKQSCEGNYPGKLRITYYDSANNKVTSTNEKRSEIKVYRDTPITITMIPHITGGLTVDWSMSGRDSGTFDLYDKYTADIYDPSNPLGGITVTPLITRKEYSTTMDQHLTFTVKWLSVENDSTNSTGTDRGGRSGKF